MGSHPIVWVICYNTTMNTELQAALIAATTTLITVAISRVIQVWVESKNHTRETQEIYSTYVEFSLKRKIETYHQLLNIIRNVGYGSSYDTGSEVKYTDQEKIKIIQTALKNLIAWEYDSGGVFFLSAESFERFRRLKTRLYRSSLFYPTTSKHHRCRIRSQILPFQGSLYLPHGRR